MTDTPQQQPPQPSTNLSSVLDDLTKKTIDLLSRIIKKPPLTPKLLSKPPFRYLHDIFSELIGTCKGFCVGLYTETEMNSELVKDKDAKIQYLTKMIDCIGIATNLEIRANPLKIVAGLDPEETNAFLQLIAKVILKKVDTTNAVARVLAGEHQGKKSAPAQAAAPTPAPAEQAPAAADQASAPPKQALQTQKTTKSTENLRKEKSASNVSLSQPKQSATGTDKQVTQPPTQSTTSTKQATPTSKEGGGKQQPAATQSSIPQQPQVKDTTKTLGRSGSGAELDQPEPTTAPAADAPNGDTSTDEPASDPRIPQPVVKRRERPISARPPPPKQRPTEIAAEETTSSVPVIISDTRKDDDEDDEFVVKAVQALKGDANAAGTPKMDEKHGGLVQKILQTKKDLEGSTPSTTDTTTPKPVSTDGKPVTSTGIKEIEALRESIQALCQSTNPLGKTMDYIQEDVDSMNKELDHWRKESVLFKHRLEDEMKVTKESLTPMEEQLKQIEESIEEQLEKISMAKATILENDATIQKILRGVTSASK